MIENPATFLTGILALTALAAVLCFRLKDIKEFLTIVVTLLVGVGFVRATTEASSSAFLIAALVIFLALVLLYKDRSPPKKFWWGLGLLSVALVSAVLYMVTGTPALLLLTFMIMVPLFPLHGGYVAILTGLPLAISAFLSLMLPLMGVYGIFSSSLGGSLPAGLIAGGGSGLHGLLMPLSIAGCVYGPLMSLVRKGGPGFIAHAGLSFFSVLWLAVSTGSLGVSSSIVYAASLGVVTSGVLLAWRCIVVRYGDVRVDSLMARVGGLVQSMPVFATLVFFIIWAAIGLPPFGLFTGLVEVMLGMSRSPAVVVALFVWFMASWYFIKFMHRVLFAPAKPGFEYKRLRYGEGVSLGLIIIVLLMLGVGNYEGLVGDIESSKANHKPGIEASLWEK